MVVCLWSPAWSTGAASAADPDVPDDDVPRPPDLAPALAELAPRIRVEPEVVWADARGLDARALAGRLLDCLTTHGVPARAGIAAIPVTAELAARSASPPTSATPAAGRDSTRFLVKDRTGWGWRSTPEHPARAGAPAPRATPDSERSDISGPAGSRPESWGGGETNRGSGVVAPSPQLPGREGEGAGSSHRQERETGEGGGCPRSLTTVRKGEEANWQASLHISALAKDARMRVLLEGVGVTTVGFLAALDREAVEVRFGPEAVALWRLARADDRRVLFRRVPRDRPCGSIDFVDYVLTDPARLLFTANALLGPLCEGLVARGEHARTLRLVLPLADGSEWSRVLRPGRPTASRDAWLRILRDLLDRLTVPDAVAGMRLEVGRTEPAAVRQGDLFDRGFATAAAVEAAVARLADLQVAAVLPHSDAHPLLERRGKWTEAPPDAVAGGTGRPVPGVRPVGRGPAGWGGGREGFPTSGGGEGKGLVLQMLPRPRRLVVETGRRRDHEVPVRLRDRGEWLEIAHAAGPDRISGGQWEAEPYAREYYRCVTGEGVPLWIYRDAREGGWWLQGWWD